MDKSDTSEEQYFPQEYSTINDDISEKMSNIRKTQKEMADKFSELTKLSETYKQNMGTAGHLKEFLELKAQLEKDLKEGQGTISHNS